MAFLKKKTCLEDDHFLLNWPFLLETCYTPETNSSHLKIDHPKKTFHLPTIHFQVQAVSFREGISQGCKQYKDFMDPMMPHHWQGPQRVWQDHPRDGGPWVTWETWRYKVLMWATYQGNTHEAGRYSPVDTDSLLKKMIFTLKTTPSWQSYHRSRHTITISVV